MGHLNFETPTLFERLADDGLRTACTPFLIYRGRTRHEVGLEGLLQAFANAARFHHAVWGPEELFYGELYSSAARSTARRRSRGPATRDAYSACVARDLVEHDLYDFLLFSLPDNDYYSHRDGPEEMQAAIALADDAMAELVERPRRHRRVPRRQRGDRDRRPRPDLRRAPARAPGRRSASAGGSCSRTASSTADDQLAVGPSGRGAGIWLLPTTATSAPASAPRSSAPPRARRRRASTCSPGSRPRASGRPLGGGQRQRASSSASGPATTVRDRRGRGWELDGDPAALSARIDDGAFLSDEYPDALARLWSALANPNAGDILVSLAARLGVRRLGRRRTTCPAAATARCWPSDSLGALLTVGLDGDRPEREQWAISDVYGADRGPFRDRGLGSPGCRRTSAPARARPRSRRPRRWEAAADWAWGDDPPRPPRHPQAGQLGAALPLRASSAAAATSST